MRRIEGCGGGIEEEGFEGGLRRRVGKEGCQFSFRFEREMELYPEYNYDTATQKRTDYLQTRKSRPEHEQSRQVKEQKRNLPTDGRTDQPRNASFHS